MMQKFSHTDTNGKARMVDISEKTVQRRVASAEGFIKLNGSTVKLILENTMRKGDVLTLAEIAGIQAAKRTSELIPLCHPLMLTYMEVKTSVEEDGIRIKSMMTCTGPTGVEMEAITAVSIALITVYDMCKAIDKGMIIEDIHLLEKSKSDIYE